MSENRTKTYKTVEKTDNLTKKSTKRLEKGDYFKNRTVFSLSPCSPSYLTKYGFLPVLYLLNQRCLMI